MPKYKHLLQAVNRIRVGNSHDLEIVIEHFTELLAKADADNRVLSSELLYRSQGKAQILADEVLDLLVNSGELLKQHLENEEETNTE